MTERLNIDLLENDINIGMMRFRVTKRVDRRHLEETKKLAGFLRQNQGEAAHALQYKLHHNSAVAGINLFGEETPLSAYYSLSKDGLNRTVLTIIWGKENDREVKVHSYLNSHPLYQKLRKDTFFQRSGHISPIHLQDSPGLFKLALLDSLHSKNGEAVVDISYSEFPIVTTLYANHIVPISSDGYVVQLKDR